jgi:hypothetical protein
VGEAQNLMLQKNLSWHGFLLKRRKIVLGGWQQRSRTAPDVWTVLLRPNVQSLKQRKTVKSSESKDSSKERSVSERELVGKAVMTNCNSFHSNNYIFARLRLSLFISFWADFQSLF